jgi:hypothetical protein
MCISSPARVLGSCFRPTFLASFSLVASNARMRDSAAVSACNNSDITWSFVELASTRTSVQRTAHRSANVLPRMSKVYRCYEQCAASERPPEQVRWGVRLPLRPSIQRRNARHPASPIRAHAIPLAAPGEHPPGFLAAKVREDFYHCWASRSAFAVEHSIGYS